MIYAVLLIMHGRYEMNLNSSIAEAYPWLESPLMSRVVDKVSLHTT